MPKLMIGVLSCKQYVDRRLACLDTWMFDATNAGADPFFSIGTPEMSLKRDGDILFVPCQDDYLSLPLKTWFMCRYALDSGADFLFKCDDDTYVHVERLLAKLEEGHDYTGYDVGTPQGILPYASGGAGYILSRKAMRWVVSRPYVCRSRADTFEDLYVGNMLRSNLIPFVADNRFSPGKELFPTPDNDVITGHYISPAQMRELHYAFNDNLP